jgi:hypothetical protein
VNALCFQQTQVGESSGLQFTSFGICQSSHVCPKVLLR